MRSIFIAAVCFLFFSRLAHFCSLRLAYGEAKRSLDAIWMMDAFRMLLFSSAELETLKKKRQLDSFGAS